MDFIRLDKKTLKPAQTIQLIYSWKKVTMSVSSIKCWVDDVGSWSTMYNIGSKDK